ncbi:hypothetical protein [Ruficoccus sp. ZRK36]|uniref:hypothetical protein n=1 Tax=Ruficoccus sp. ZRK36 TaxID=2866311 RepID=UPI001C733E99|nr:hypothetical protein [Ruficoccus sp. ZRK36]QYY35270.1 hypothetical protein K0V07_13335 [Ruficoccus sp. ZRK36]
MYIFYIVRRQNSSTDARIPPPTPEFLHRRRELLQEQREVEEKNRIAELRTYLAEQKNIQAQREREEIQKRLESAQKRHDALERSIRDLESYRLKLRRRSPKELASDLYPSVVTREDIRSAMQMLYRRIRQLREMENTEVEAPGQLYLPFLDTKGGGNDERSQQQGS